MRGQIKVARKATTPTTPSNPTGWGGKRAGSGQKKGQVSALKRDLADKMSPHVEAAIKTLVSIATDVNALDAARVSAANSILDRVYGRPAQQLQHTGLDDGAIEHEVIFSDAERFTGAIIGLTARERAKEASE